MNDSVNSVRQHFKHFILFTLILSFLFILIQIPFYKGQEYGYQYKHVMIKLKYLSMENDNSIDVIFLGDSEGKDSFDPVTLFHNQGISSYNLCTNFQWSLDTLALTKNMYQYQSPKLIVMETNFFLTTLRKRRILLAKYLPIFNYHELYKEYLLYPQSADEWKEFSATNQITPYTGTLDYMTTDNSYYPVDEWTLDYMRQVKEILDQHGTKLLMVSAPSPLNWTTSKHNTLQEWCDQNNVTYIDYNLNPEELNINWLTDTRDGGDHLNYSGSEKFMNVLGKYLQENYELTDHRNDPAYTKWNEDYKSIFGGAQ